ncbi:hypothetical protein [uncultured Clostridium sp.]|jgi:large-conductance mechanosensitive channel|uniref:hypothetical protein n=1 Tax=uncultured Clostridium sp. TaxID=59620 RepID=UPI002605E09A|nr:hypothetical protein [uncultured Clostridium sp.]
MDIINIIYEECNSLGSSFGFGAFEGGVIYFSVFSLIIFKFIDAISNTLKKKKTPVKLEEDELTIKVKVIK